MNIIAVDLGNTRAKFGYFPSLATSATYPEPKSTFTDKPRDFSALADWLSGLDVVPNEPIFWRIARTGTFPWEEFQKKLAGLRPSDCFSKLSYLDIPLTLDVEFPEKVGIDRILAAYAARCWREQSDNAKLFVNSSRFLVVDAGSAITVDLVGGEGQFAGGAIFPGLGALAESLARISSNLPKVPTQEISFAVYPGKNTEEALSAGIYWGAVGAIRQFRQIVHFSLVDADLPSRVPIFLTGGDAESLSSGVSLFQKDLHDDGDELIILPDLVLSGIALAARNIVNAPKF